MRSICWLAVVGCALGWLVGCADLGHLEHFRALNRQNLTYLKVGMSKEDVIERMGTGFATDTYASLEEVTATNPYSSEIYQQNGQTFEVLYYYTDTNRKSRMNVYLPGIQKATPIQETELTPVVLQHGRVIGWGQSFSKTVLRNSSGTK